MLLGIFDLSKTFKTSKLDGGVFHLVGRPRPVMLLNSMPQSNDGLVEMCWEKETEKYNDGQAFKICHRTHEGIIVTILADNYYGYCKKEVKTQLVCPLGIIIWCVSQRSVLCIT